MELEIMYPETIGYSLAIAFAILLIWRRHGKYKKGVIVANTKYIKKTGYYKKLMIKYRIYNILIKALCILAIFTCSIITARLYAKKDHEEEYYNRDIVLCMDVSGSMTKLNKSIIETMKQTVLKLKDERISIVAFNSSPVTILPLTSDYNYAVMVLDEIAKSLNGTNSKEFNFLTSGTSSAEGSSRIGDGLAYCAMEFKKDDDRTKAIILTTDNQIIAGIETLAAANLAKSYDVKVYPIDPNDASKANPTVKSKIEELKQVASITGGKYYSFNQFSTNDIYNDIEKLNKTAMIRNAYVSKTEYPELIVPYLIYLIPLMLLIDWRVRI